MSMNLHIKVNGKDLELFQTPTQITEMCMCTEDGVVFELNGKKAKRAIECYVAYVKGSLNGAYKSLEDVSDAQTLVKKHINYIRESIAVGKKISVYQM